MKVIVCFVDIGGILDHHCLEVVILEINHGSQNVLGVLTCIGGY